MAKKFPLLEKEVSKIAKRAIKEMKEFCGKDKLKLDMAFCYVDDFQDGDVHMSEIHAIYVKEKELMFSVITYYDGADSNNNDDSEDFPEISFDDIEIIQMHDVLCSRERELFIENSKEKGEEEEKEFD